MNLMDLFIKIGVDDQASSNIDKITGKIGNGLKKAAEVGVAALATVSAGVAALGKASIEAYADYEQLVGGIETLFKESAGQVQQYAADAYKTAGLSANDYMETVTSFSASLLQATGRGAQTNLEELEGYLEAEYEAAKETYSAEYDARKEALDAEYKATKEAYDAEYNALKEAQTAEIEAYTAAADAKIASIDKADKEAVAAAKQEKKDTLAAMKAGNKKELDELKASNKKQLETQKQGHSDELAALKKSNSAKLNVQKAAIADQVAAAEEANMVSVTTLESQAEAAELADMAIRDMSDNANKMGTDMAMIQNAYQGFAKANYTMLDNLKLGYGGTKGEMERLIADAAKLSDTVDAQSLAFDNVVKAIHVVQDELGITGTTAKEAGTTIAGSVSSMKAAWENLKVGIADENADIGQLFKDLVVTITGDGSETNLGVMGNLLPRVKQVFKGMREVAEEAAPYIAKAGDFIVDKFVEKLENPEGLFDFLDGAIAIVSGVTDGFEDDGVVAKIGNGAQTFIEKFKDWLQEDEKLEKLKDGALSIIQKLGDFIGENAGNIAFSAISLISNLVSGFLTAENIAKLSEAAGDVVDKLADGLSESAYEIGRGTGEITSAIVNDLLGDDEAWENVGESIGSRIAQGLINTVTGLWDTFVASLYGGQAVIEDFLGFDKAAERDYQNFFDRWEKGGIWTDLIEGFHEGTESSKAPEIFAPNNTSAFDAFSKSQEEIQKELEGKLGYAITPAPRISEEVASSERTGAYTFARDYVGGGVQGGEPIQVNLELDGETLASALLDPLNKRIKQKGVNVLA